MRYLTVRYLIINVSIYEWKEKINILFLFLIAPMVCLLSISRKRQGPPLKIDAALHTSQLERSVQDKQTAHATTAVLGQQLQLPPPPNLRSDRVTSQAA